MKRWAKAWLAVGVGCCVCGAALTGIGVASGGSKYVKSAVAAFGAAVFCCIGGIILVFYNEKKINGIINRHQ